MIMFPFYNPILLGCVRTRRMMLDPMFKVKSIHKKFGFIVRTNYLDSFMKLGLEKFNK